MKADRITKLVEQTSGDLDMWSLDERHLIITLLRRERSYQLARVRRIIKAESARLARMEMTSREGKAWITAKQNVLAVIWAALNRRTP